jgi:hypothetical protein
MNEMTDFGKRLRNSHKMRRIELIHFYEYLVKEGIVSKDGAAYKRMVDLKKHVTAQDKRERLKSILKMRENKEALK